MKFDCMRVEIGAVEIILNTVVVDKIYKSKPWNHLHLIQWLSKRLDDNTKKYFHFNWFKNQYIFLLYFASFCFILKLHFESNQNEIRKIKIHRFFARDYYFQDRVWWKFPTSYVYTVFVCLNDVSAWGTNLSPAGYWNLGNFRRVLYLDWFLYFDH